MTSGTFSLPYDAVKCEEESRILNYLEKVLPRDSILWLEFLGPEPLPHTSETLRFSAGDAEKIFSMGDRIAEEILNEVIIPLDRDAKAHDMPSLFVQILCRENALLMLMGEGLLPPLPELPPPPSWGVWGAATWIPIWEEVTEEKEKK